MEVLLGRHLKSVSALAAVPQLPARRRRRGEGLREPARARMDVLSELLDFQAHDCARGRTVEREFLEDLAVALGEDPTGLPNKDEIISLCIQSVIFGPLQKKQLSTGGTITDSALQAVVDGVLALGRQKVSLRQGAAAARVAVALKQAHPSDDPFADLDLSDERKASLRMVVDKPWQPSFRSNVLRAYEGRCCVTGSDVVEALEAAHIRPFKGPRTNTIVNGLALRADVHRLWDRGLVAVDESSLEVLVAPRLHGTAYEHLRGGRISTPVDSKQHPSALALEQQRIWCGL